MKPIEQKLDKAMKSLATIVEQRRQRLGFSQEELARKAGVSRAYLSDVERALRNVSIITLVKLATALDTMPSNLLREVEEMVFVEEPALTESGGSD